MQLLYCVVHSALHSNAAALGACGGPGEVMSLASGDSLQVMSARLHAGAARYCRACSTWQCGLGGMQAPPPPCALCAKPSSLLTTAAAAHAACQVLYALQYLAYVVAAPIEVAVLVVLSCQQVGVAAGLAGLIPLAVFVPLNLWLLHASGTHQVRHKCSRPEQVQEPLPACFFVASGPAPQPLACHGDARQHGAKEIWLHAVHLTAVLRPDIRAQAAARDLRSVRMNLAHDGIVSNAVVKLLGLEGKLAAEADAVRTKEEKHLGWVSASYGLTLNIQIGHVAALMVRGRHAWAQQKGFAKPGEGEQQVVGFDQQAHARLPDQP